MASLRRGLSRWQTAGRQDEGLRDACIQRFEYTCELRWKMLARRLKHDLPDARSVDAMRFRDKRNTTSHTYNAAKAADVAAIIPDFADEAQALLTQLQSKGAHDA